MRKTVLLSLVLAVCGALSCSRSPERSPAQAWAAGELPVPPARGRSWKAPKTKLPEAFVDATRTLFSQGLADPRGLEYREIEVRTGGRWGEGGAFKTHGWVFPSDDNPSTSPFGPELKAEGLGAVSPSNRRAQRFAVCWNGLVYPVLSVAAPADVKKDAAAALAMRERARADWQRDNPDRGVRQFDAEWMGEPNRESAAVDWARPQPFMACLLLRLGEGDLADRVMDALPKEAPLVDIPSIESPPRSRWSLWRSRGGDESAADKDDPYLALAALWTSALYERTLSAHMRADDATALATARFLERLRGPVDAEVERRGFKRETTATGEPEPYLAFLGTPPRLLADLERRAKEPRRTPVLVAGLDTFPGRRERVAALIRDLEDVSARERVSSAEPDFLDDPAVRALVDEGDDAVEPLLECIEHDERLTRAVPDSTMPEWYRGIVYVHWVADAAHAALGRILRVSTFEPRWTGPTGYGRQEIAWRSATAGGIRAFWNAGGKRPVEERLFRALADDKAPGEQWLEAAEALAGAADGSDIPSARDRMSGITRRPKPGAKMLGEPLRAKADPSVADLMRRRIDDFVHGRAKLSRTCETSSQMAYRMADCLGRWDAKAAVPTLRELLANGGFSGWNARLTLARVRGGDAAALDDYARWLGARKVPCAVGELEPLWACPDHPAIRAAAERYFGGQSPLFAKEPREYDASIGSYVRSPLIQLDVFRRFLLGRLADKSLAGAAVRTGAGRIEIRRDGDAVARTLDAPGDPLLPPVQTPAPFRACDVCAEALSEIDGMPKIELYWPEAKRDEAVAGCAAVLRRYGARYRAVSRSEAFEEPVRLELGELDHPATTAEVEQGLAIFSLAGEGDTRKVPLPLPLPAFWKALKDYPREYASWNPDTRTWDRKEYYSQSGRVLQAEEVLRDGKWRRYYGFVGASRIAKVPAEEIELYPAQGPWTPISDNLWCWTEVGLPTEKERFRGVPRGRVGEAVPVTVSLRSAAGLDLDVPATLCRLDKAGGVLLRSGFDVKLEYSPSEIVTCVLDNSLSPGNRAECLRDWTALRPRIAGGFKDDDTRTLAPAEAAALGRLDLADLFDLTRPGTYRLTITFSASDFALPKDASVAAVFVLTLPPPDSPLLPPRRTPPDRH